MQLDLQDSYDLVIVVLPTPALAKVLPILAANRNTPSVMFLGNNTSGPEPMVSALGRERVLLGFPGAAKIPIDHAIRYIITSRREQPTTIAELDGRRSERIATIADMLEAAGFPASVCENMDAWLTTHVAKILPTAGALSYAGGHPDQLASNREALRLMVCAIREAFELLRANNIPITPSNHRVLLWLAESLIVFIMKRMFGGKTIAIKVGHVEHAKSELQILAREFRGLNDATRLPTQAMDRLFEHHAAAVVHDSAR